VVPSQGGGASQGGGTAAARPAVGAEPGRRRGLQAVGRRRRSLALVRERSVLAGMRHVRESRKWDLDFRF
jgi:hypothetical protein